MDPGSEVNIFASEMDQGLVDSTGYPTGSLYIPAHFLAGIQALHSLEFCNRRGLFLQLGVPPERIRTVSARIIATQFSPIHKDLGIDIFMGENLPDDLFKE